MLSKWRLCTISKCELQSALFMMERLLQSSCNGTAMGMKKYNNSCLSWNETLQPVLLAFKTLESNLLKLSKISISPESSSPPCFPTPPALVCDNILRTNIGIPIYGPPSALIVSRLSEIVSCNYPAVCLYMRVMRARESHSVKPTGSQVMELGAGLGERAGPGVLCPSY